MTRVLAGVRVESVLDALAQTQCTRCGYADCAAYAQAIVQGEADIDQCTPGGSQGVLQLAAITGLAAKPLNPAFGPEKVRSVAYIDENWCIGCTLCIKACPTDAIVGAHKTMHTVIEAACTGCELCLPVCPVDCIVLEPVGASASEWTAGLAAQARERYAARGKRLAQEEAAHALRQEQSAQAKIADIAAHSQHTDPAILEQKRQTIAAALERARLKKQSPTTR